jgi:membrane peptidoglycan carboxypeptidase
MVTAYSVIANGGVYIKPKIINSLRYPDGKVVEYKPEISHRVIKKSTAETVSKLLQDGVDNGVAGNAKVP